jgi:hypothetical protein
MRALFTSDPGFYPYALASHAVKASIHGCVEVNPRGGRWKGFDATNGLGRDK